MNINLSINLIDVEMDVSEAWILVQQAGFNITFYSWELFLTLGPYRENPYYVFCVSGGRREFVFVDTVIKL